MKKIVISHVGLLERDMVLLKNLSQLSTTWLGNFELADHPGQSGGQLLIVDADSEASRRTWYELKSHSWFEKTIVISRQKSPIKGADIQLTRPLIFRRLADALQKVMSEPSNRESSRQGKRVLVVDDSPAVQTFLNEKLRHFLDGDTVIDIAESGEAAIAQAQDTEYDLVFMDVMMPGMDGYTACKMIKAHSQSKVVMLTSKSSAINRVKAKLSGCDGYITKPPKDQELAQVLQRYVGAPEHTTSINNMPVYGR